MIDSNSSPSIDCPSNGCPDDEAWRDWIRGNGTGTGEVAVSEDQLTSHLDRCETCQCRVLKLSEDDPFYSQSRDALRSTGLTSHDWRDMLGAASDRLPPQTSTPAVVSLVQSLLGPSDDERSLGRLGRFEILGVVGSGGMGIVLKARSIAMDRIVAIKIPQPQYWQSPETLRTLEREARSAAAVVHPNVIAIYHVDRYRDVPYLVMPYLPGQSLEQRIQDTGPMPVAESLRITRQVASALAAAHACGVVHRDVKPANILLGAGTERAVLSDFGLAKVQSDATCTATGTFAGTPIYLSPEQASGCGAGPAGDIYSLGTVMWTMLCGQPPMSGMHTHAIVCRIAESRVPSLSDHRWDLPEWLFRLIARLHADAPADRPTADQLANWIEVCQRYMIDSQSVQLPEELRMEKSKSMRWRRWVAAAAASILLAVGGWFLFGSAEADSNASALVSETIADVETQANRPKPDVPSSEGSLHEGPAFEGTAFEGTAFEETALVGQEAAPVAGPDETDVYLDQVQGELTRLNENMLPELESEIERLTL